MNMNMKPYISYRVVVSLYISDVAQHPLLLGGWVTICR